MRPDAPLEHDDDAPIDELVDRLLRGERVDVEGFLDAKRELDPASAERVRKLAAVLGAADGRERGEPLSRTELGDYRLIRELGRGGMGTVYLAEQRALSRLVALKVLRADLAASPRARERFAREAMAIAKLRHPSIVTIHDAGEADGIAYLAMELLAGHGLDERVHGGAASRMPLPDVVRAVRDVARALQCAHEAGIVHRDVKPSNVRVTPEGRAVLLDFGLAHGEEWHTLTDTGQFRGTPHYAAPEQIDPSLGPVDARSDVYSLGVTLYECATGRRLFEGASTKHVFHQVLHKEPTAPRRLAPDVSRDLDTVICKAIAKERAHRYASAAELADDLDALLAMRPVRARPLHPAARLARFFRRRPAIAVIAALAAVLFGVVPWVFAVTKQRALAEILRLSDSARVRDLETRETGLWPRRRERITDMEAWLAEARELALRVGAHRATLARLGERVASGDSSPELRWQHATLAALVERLDRLPVTIADVEARLAIALVIDRETIESRAAEWDEARAAIAASELYGSLALAPQPGLVPLGPDPESGLWEFLAWETGVPPERDGATDRWRVDDDTGLVLVLIPGGPTRIGSQAARPQESNYDPRASAAEPLQETRLDPYFLAKHEMTQGQWQRIAGSNPSALQVGANYVATFIDAERPLAHPVEQVGRDEAASILARLGLELPTDAQWEHAARGGSSSVWWFGDETEPLRDVANLLDRSSQAPGSGMTSMRYEDWDDGFTYTAPAGSFEPNPFGLHDVYGNVWEWCREDFFAPAELVPGDGRRVPLPGTALTTGGIVRGGSYSNSAEDTRSAARTDYPLQSTAPLVGVRPARRIDPR